MNKMQVEVYNHTSKSKHTVSFFDDDSIEVVRQQIGRVTDIHPDRLFILIALKLPADYYLVDRRRWEMLFERLSYDGSPLDKVPFQSYQTEYRTPNTAIAFKEYDKSEWMGKPDELHDIFEPATEFTEYRIFGVPELNSFVLPLNVTSISKIPAARLPVPNNGSLFNSLYDNAVRFVVIPFEETESLAYFPLLKSKTPARLTDETIGLLTKNAKLLENLLALKAPEPESITIVRTRFYIPWVETELGAAIRTRFEQMFYGLTVSEETPYIGIFTSKDQVTRHKFYVENPKNKKPVLDMTMWNTWWSLTKPSRSKPTLLLFRGKSKHHFDRIAITAIDMVINTYRPEGNTETISELKKQTSDWLKSLDSIIPFLDEADIHHDRWDLQDMSFLAKYKEKLEDFELLRFGCISSIFNIADKSKSQFSILRTDNANDGLSAVEIKLLAMMKEGRPNPSEVATELGITIESARALIVSVESRLDEEPRLGQKSFRGYPTLRVGSDFVIASSVTELEHPVQYSNILRYVLSDVDSAEINKLCPKRVERVATEAAAPATLEVDAALVEEFGDLFGELEEEDEVESVAETIVSQRISTEQKRKTLYSYFQARLQQFDPETFAVTGSKYPKKCEQKHQPIILSDSDSKRLSGTPYDPKSYAKDGDLIDIEEPDGTIVCPDYWCMKDQIPLKESQLEDKKCPVCHGKLQTHSTDNPREFPLVKRETGFIYPGYTRYKSHKNGKVMPCCFKTSSFGKKDKTTGSDDKYYILKPDSTDIDESRIAFLSESMIASLRIHEKYEGFATRRLQGSMSGFFRVGLGKPSHTLPSFLGSKAKIPAPHESVETVLKCSFLRTWKTPGTKYLDVLQDIELPHLAPIISGISEAYESGELSQLEDLEYSALALQCDVFRIFLDTNELGCMFYTPIVRPRHRGIVIFQSDDEIDILSHTIRKTRGFEFQANVFASPFKPETYVELEKLRNESCSIKMPTYDDALNVMKELGEDWSIILDPFGRGQALYSDVIIPFQSTVLPDVAQTKINGYSDVTELPTYDREVEALIIAAKINSGYTYKEDLYNTKSEVVELLTESGLRVPIQPKKAEARESGEVYETVTELGETELVFGEPSESLRDSQRTISYSSEVFEFLLFQLSNDISTDYAELRNALQEASPTRAVVQPALKDWFDKTTQFIDIKTPTQFLSKIRTPCGQLSKKDCSGNLCGWDSDSGKCNIQIGSTIKKEGLFNRLLSTLLDNSKTRAILLDGRATPFFSTVLYLELPHELIVTDMDLPD